MNSYIASIAALLGFTFAFVCQATPPTNDNFTNRVVLTGTDVTFTGTLKEATREQDPYEVVPFDNPDYTKTVWWEWTAPTSTTVVVEILNPPKPVSEDNALAIYTLENIYTGQVVGQIPIEAVLPARSIRFQAEAGTNYQIQLAGNSDASFDIRLIATNAPCIVQQPQTMTVSTDASAMFGVVAAGNPPLAYQWQHNGTNLDGETAPMLGLDYLTTNQAGKYRVIVTNAGGMTVSEEAHLFVAPTDVPPILATAELGPSNMFKFVVLGEPGRRYRIESSTNLVDWSPQKSFPSASKYTDFPGTSGSNLLQSVVYDSSGTNTLGLGQTGAQKFLRTSIYHAPNEVCINNLRMIRFAQKLFAYDSGYSSHGAVTLDDVLPYFKNQAGPLCPTYPGAPYYAYYSVSLIDADPICLVVLAHRLEEP